jgi:hypothetical protein
MPIAAAIALLPTARAARADDVSGVVKEQGGGGVSGITVYLASDKKTIKVGSSDTSGAYQGTVADNGSYTVKLKAIGYSRMAPAYDYTVTIQGKAAPLPIDDIVLIRNTEKKEKLFAVGVGFAGTVKPKDANKQYESLWNNLREGGMPPAAKYHIVAGINERDAAAKTAFKPFGDYLAAKAEDIEVTEAAVKDALLHDVPLPRPTVKGGNFPARGAVLSDVVLHTLVTTGSPAQKDLFLKNLDSAAGWKDVNSDVTIWYGKLKGGAKKGDPP